MALVKIISGAQTGADQAGLAAACHLGLEVGGWMPYGRRTEDGPMSIELFNKYKLKQHPSPNYPPRTEQNVRESDGTVLFGNLDSPGCRLTMQLCDRHHKHYPGNPLKPEYLRAWVEQHDIKVLNVAGNRESTNPGIFDSTVKFLVEAFKP